MCFGQRLFKHQAPVEAFTPGWNRLGTRRRLMLKSTVAKCSKGIGFVSLQMTSSDNRTAKFCGEVHSPRKTPEKMMHPNDKQALSITNFTGTPSPGYERKIVHSNDSRSLYTYIYIYTQCSCHVEPSECVRTPKSNWNMQLK